MGVHVRQTLVVAGLAAGLLAVPLEAHAAPVPVGKIVVAPGGGPLGAVAVIRGTCPEMFAGAGHAAVRVGFAFSNAFDNRGSLSTFHETAPAIAADGSFTAKLAVGPAVAYTPVGAGPAAPGKEVLRKPKAGDALIVQAICFSKASANPTDVLLGRFQVAAALPALVRTVTPRITGAARVGSTLTVTAGTWRPAATTVTFQWLRAGKPIVGARLATYKATAADAGKALSVRVTATRTGHPAGVTITAPVIVKAATATAPPPGVTVSVTSNGTVIVASVG